MNEKTMTCDHFQVGLSFASEDREFVEPIAKALRDRGVAVFYDNFFEAEIWGKNLQEFLSEVYTSHCQYCVVFVSQAYLDSEWTKLERRSVQETALRMNEEYLLPIRLDDTNLPGLSKDVAYLDLRERSTSDVVDFLSKKLGVTSPVPSCLKDGLLIELSSGHEFKGDDLHPDMEMHSLHEEIVRFLGGHECYILGCSSSPHRLQLYVTRRAYDKIRLAFLDQSLEAKTGVPWKRLAYLDRCGPADPPRQVPAVTSAGGVPGRQVVCHAGHVQGFRDEALMAHHYLGWDSVSDIRQTRAFVAFLGDFTYMHTNFKKPGYENTTKIVCESGMDLFDFLINAVCTKWPNTQELLALKEAHESCVEYLVLRTESEYPGDNFYREAMNIRFVDPPPIKHTSVLESVLNFLRKSASQS